MIASIWLWVGFSLFILAMLALDLGVFHRKAQPVSSKEALGWTAIWVTLALLFGAGVWHFAGQEKALEFYTGWLIEYSLSVDNVFVFALIFSYFAVPPAWQHKVLFWGILGALVMRLAMIGAGVTLMARFSWVLYFSARFSSSQVSEWRSGALNKSTRSATRSCVGFANAVTSDP